MLSVVLFYVNVNEVDVNDDGGPKYNGNYNIVQRRQVDSNVRNSFNEWL